MNSDQNESVLKNLINSLIDDDFTEQIFTLAVKYGNEWALKYLIKNNSYQKIREIVVGLRLEILETKEEKRQQSYRVKEDKEIIETNFEF